MARFLHGLNHDIANVVELQHYVELEDMVHMAKKVEWQLKRKRATNKIGQILGSSSSWGHVASQCVNKHTMILREDGEIETEGEFDDESMPPLEDANDGVEYAVDGELLVTSPKDCYPMPNIDKVVEAAFGNERLSLLDAYSGYHQVPIAPEDEENTSFYTCDEIYCYVMMPFGLKNSLKAKDHLADLDETFNNLRKNRMQLNLTKCIFGLESRKFLGFMVSKKGIEVNPEKIKAIAEMEPPRSIKDVQRLTGRVAAFHSLPFLLTKVVDGKILYLYLGMSNEAIGSVLVREEGKQQKPVYYTSSVLHGAKVRYSIVEKAALAVVTLTRKLRPYFQSHPIIILTDQHLRHILQKLECSRRLIKLAVELGEFEITFQQRLAIRAQALADFIVECTSDHSNSNPEPNSWILYVDGASSNKSFEAGAILVGPNGYRRMRLRKKASRYTLVDGVLYKRSFSLLLRCLNLSEAEYTLREVHEGVCGSHVGARTLAHKVLRQGYYWPNMYKDAIHFVQRCLKCKFFAHLTHQPTKELTNLVAPWPLAQWGLDLLGQFIKGVEGVTHLVVGVDYFTKWVETRPLSSFSSKKVEDFVFSSIIYRYGIPNQIVVDNGI
ncbi:hypothetical protein SLEP1_g54089 [Rubroshorea leprosula]|uniref:Integrase catalytic domain-containing protein n=1 Tax=Rubroshorea leprosula TaxID=152421 RepID=A0AAV5ME88_9ROSI|nr:hypothetical protein SLEP1_g54089 [Rubroshorea leprosula]